MIFISIAVCLNVVWISIVLDSSFFLKVMTQGTAASAESRNRIESFFVFSRVLNSFFSFPITMQMKMSTASSTLHSVNTHHCSVSLFSVRVCVRQIQRALLRNNQTQRFSQKQAFRLHQGLVTSTAEQVRVWFIIYSDWTFHFFIPVFVLSWFFYYYYFVVFFVFWHDCRWWSVCAFECSSRFVSWKAVRKRRRSRRPDKYSRRPGTPEL